MNRKNPQYKRFSTIRNPIKKDEIEAKPGYKSKNLALEEVLPPRSRQTTTEITKRSATNNRCCFISPDRKDFSQIAEFGAERYQNILREQYGFDPIIVPITESKLDAVKTGVVGDKLTVNTSSQYVNLTGSSYPKVVLDSECQWDQIGQNVEETEPNQTDSAKNIQRVPSNIQIGKKPRVKVIVEKYTKIKKENIEVRRLDEKIVCVEYDVFNPSKVIDNEPIQCLRAFFSLKPSQSGVIVEENSELKDTLKNKFDIEDEDLNKLNMKEIEIIDGAIEQNKSYLEDLNKILQKRDFMLSKKQSSFNLDFLYKIAKTDRTVVEQGCSDKFLSKADLEHVKEIILQKGHSSVHSFNRRTVLPTELDKPNSDKNKCVAIISKCIINELMRQLNTK